MSRTTDRIGTKVAQHRKAQTMTKGAAARARKEMGKSFRKTPPELLVRELFKKTVSPHISHIDEWIELGYPQGPEVDPIDET